MPCRNQIIERRDEVMMEFDKESPDVVDSLDRAEEVLAFASEFLYRAVRPANDQAWDGNPESFLGLAHVLFELRFEIRNIAGFLKEEEKSKRDGPEARSCSPATLHSEEASGDT
jgi:hypothetical protein